MWMGASLFRKSDGMGRASFSLQCSRSAGLECYRDKRPRTALICQYAPANLGASSSLWFGMSPTARQDKHKKKIILQAKKRTVIQQSKERQLSMIGERISYTASQIAFKQ